MWVYAIWGILGGLATEGIEVIRVQRYRDPPWKEYSRYIYILRIVIRMCLGGCIAAALGSSGEIKNSLMALMSGAGAPLFLEKALQIKPVGLAGQEGQAQSVIPSFPAVNSDSEALQDGGAALSDTEKA